MPTTAFDNRVVLFSGGLATQDPCVRGRSSGPGVLLGLFLTDATCGRAIIGLSQQRHPPS
jgi:hypothetical protein